MRVPTINASCKWRYYTADQKKRNRPSHNKSVQLAAWNGDFCVFFLYIMRRQMQCNKNSWGIRIEVVRPLAGECFHWVLKREIHPLRYQQTCELNHAIENVWKKCWIIGEKWINVRITSQTLIKNRPPINELLQHAIWLFLCCVWRNKSQTNFHDKHANNHKLNM